MTFDPASQHPACELATPTLSALEWAQRPQKLPLPAESVEKIVGLAAAPTPPNARLRAAVKRRRR